MQLSAGQFSDEIRSGFGPCLRRETRSFYSEDDEAQ